MIFIEKTTPSSITAFHDILSNDLLSVQEKWSFEFKTFRTTVKNVPANDSKLMHSITFTHRDNRTVTIKNKSAIITISGSNVPERLTSNGCSANAPEPFDNLLQTKLSNLWTQRQSIKGEFGSTYRTTELVVRATNVFSYGGFKGLLLELECVDDVSLEEFEQRVDHIRTFLKEISIIDIKISMQRMAPTKPNFLCDLAYQYVKALEL